MAIRPFNSVEGFSTGDTPVIVVYANAHVAAASLNVAGFSNLGAVGNVTITGGTAGQVLTTDGNGVLSFSTVAGTGGMMPYYIGSGETYTIPQYKQGLFSVPITVDGDLVVNGVLVQVS